MARLNKQGKLSLLRVHDVGTKFGPNSDQIDVEVVVQFVGDDRRSYGFKLRRNDDGPARQGMLDLLRDAFNHNWTVHIDYDIPETSPPKKNGVIMRTWLTK